LKFLYNSDYFLIVGLVLYKAEVEGRNYQQKITLQLQQVYNFLAINIVPSYATLYCVIWGIFYFGFFD